MGADSAPIFLRNGMKVQYCFIRENYFTEHSSFINMLDAGQTKKHSNRVHLCISVEDDENRYVIPLRNNLGKYDHKSRSKATGGTGLGLAIVKHIVEIHDAKNELDSAPGVGTTISVMF